MMLPRAAGAWGWSQRGATSSWGGELPGCPEGLAVVMQEAVAILGDNPVPGMPPASASLP